MATSWVYDTFGRLPKEIHADGTQLFTTYVYCVGVNGGTGVCPTNGAYYVQAKPVAADGVTTVGATVKTYYDTLSRIVASDTASFDTSAHPWIRSDMFYDTFGHVAQVDRPYFLASTMAPALTVSSFTDPHGNIDPLGRAWSVVAPDASVTIFGYDGLVTSVTNARGAVTTTTRNAQGLPATITDANGQAMTYTYDAFGDVLTVSAPGGGTIVNTYDLRGRKLSANDPDMGLWSYATDAFGALYQQTDAKSQTSSLAYDLLGRMVSRTEPDMTATWVYGTSLANHNIDKLLSAACTGAACGPSYSRNYTFDALARPLQTNMLIGGTSYHATASYDPTTGKLAQARFFSGFTVNYAYTARGYLSTITDATAGTAYFTANARDAELHLTQSTAGNTVVTNDAFDPETGRMLNVCASNHTGACDGDVANVSTSFDAVGNLSDRGDMLHGVSETSSYDLLNRLTGYTVVGTGVSLSRAMQYNAAGSITEKSDVCATANCYAYTGTRPHALSAIAGSYAGVTNPNFLYDANGNLQCVTSVTSCDTSAAKTVAWTSSNMVTSVTEGTTTLSLLYDSEHARVQQTTSAGTTNYFNDAATNSMNERFAPIGGGTVTWKNYLTVDGKIVAERTSQDATVTVRYFVLDHLGSTIALTSETGALVESDAYDAWGKQRNPTTGADDTTCSLPTTNFSTRGFTGQEQMPGLCLVNYNARIYDPTLGKMLSPDDIIPDANNGQSYNRYTYVDDNPLSYEDPTGHMDCTQCTGESSLFPDPADAPQDDQYNILTDAFPTGPGLLSHSLSTGTTAKSSSESGITVNDPQAPSNTSASGDDASRSPGVPIKDLAARAAFGIDQTNAASGFGAFDAGISADDSHAQQTAETEPDLYNMANSGFSNRSIAQGAVGIVVTGLAITAGAVTAPALGVALLGVAAGITVLDAVGAFNPVYDDFSSQSRF